MRPLKPEGLKELDQKIEEVIKTAIDALWDLNHIIYYLLKPLKEKGLITHDEYYEIQKTREEIIELRRRLEELGGDL